jgi:Galactose oxidase, central domain/Kelch motif
LAPAVTTGIATSIASNSATLSGTVNPNGCNTTVRFQYGTTTNYGSVTANQSYNGNTTQNVNGNISGLTASTTYHFRIVAINSGGTTYGSDRTFTTLSATGPPVVTSNPPTYISSCSATLNGSLDPHGLTTTVYFQYGTTTSYGLTTPMQSQTGNTFRNISANISSLSANTVYHFRIVAVNSGGTTYGADRIFTTLSTTGPPVVTSNPPTYISSCSATLNGSLDPHELTTNVHFQYGTTTSYGSTTAAQTQTGCTYRNISANISGLAASTTYHFRIVATNSAGTTYGADRIFTTLSATGPPVVITNPASLIASFSATLNGLITPRGLTTTVYFQYGTTTSYGSTTTAQTQTGCTYRSITANISGLSASTTYHFRIVAANSAGTTYGNDRTFTTLTATGPPVVTTNPATNVTSSSATLNGSLNPHGLTTSVSFQYGTTTSYGHTTPIQSQTGNTFRNISANINGLTTHTTYHFRIVATNSGGTTNGSDRTFTTLASSSPTPTPTSTATPTPTPACIWMTKSPVLYNARGIFAVSDGTYVYCGGGYDGTAARADLLRYNPATNSWMSLASSPDQHYLSQAVYYNGKIYNMGGFNASFVSTNITRIYDISANTWTTGAPVPVALSDMATTLWNGTIYVAGGYNGSGAVSTLYAYNIGANTWSTLAPMPQTLYLAGFGAIGGKLYIASGNNGTSELNTLYIYDIASNTWTTGANVPTAVTAPGSTMFCGKLYLYGGGYPTPHNITQIYNPVTNSWSTGPNLNVARLWFYGSAVDSTSIVAPGGNTTSPVNANEQLAGCTCP